MTTQSIQFYKKRNHIIDEHVNGLIVTTKAIVTPHGIVANKPYKTIKPVDGENIVTTSTVPDFFEHLQLINIILTNACNLSCDYCYEQHKLDYGRFTPESLKQIYDFLLNCNDVTMKHFQFFGGEPLIHKKLILEFLRKYEPDLTASADRQHIDMVTNGLLLTPEFIDEYFGYNFTGMLISLDTTELEHDHRDLSQEQQDHILKMLAHIVKVNNHIHTVCVRNTVSVETAPRLISFVEQVIAIGIKNMVIHPLTMSFSDGFVMWPDEAWLKLRKDISYLIMTYPDFNIEFSEGVGIKGKSNCMIGSDMIAMDGSGDYSGCYFFTNMKEQLGSTILGNLFNDAVYIDRYTDFQNQYEQMFLEEAQCKTCTMHDECYQCPAGNLSTGDGRMFRPDGMCMEIVSLYNTLHNKSTQSALLRKMKNIISAVEDQGEEFIFAKSLLHLLYFHLNKYHIRWDNTKMTPEVLPPYNKIAGYFADVIRSQSHETTSLTDPYTLIRHIWESQSSSVGVDDVYKALSTARGAPTDMLANNDVSDLNKRIFYLTMLHLLVLSKKGDAFYHRAVSDEPSSCSVK